MKMKLFGLILLLLSFAIVGCSEKTIRGDEPPKPIITIDSQAGAITDKKPQIPVFLGSYAWKSEVDKMNPLELLKGHKPIIVADKSSIEVKFDYEPNPTELFIREVDPNTGNYISEQKLDNGVFTVSDKVGTHIYALDAKWGKKGKKK